MFAISETPFLFISWFSKFSCQLDIQEDVQEGYSLSSSELQHWLLVIQQYTQHILYCYGLRHTSFTYRYFLKLTRKMFCNELKMGQFSKHL